jgi:itaconyl-CoA hydratase
VDQRETTSRPGYGIVTWRTRGTTAKGDTVLEYQRANLVRKRKPA